MNRRLVQLFGVVAVAVLAGCKGDPLADNGGKLQRVDLQFNYLEVVIGDSTRTFAVERDALNDPLPPTATVRSCDPSIASVSTASDAPQLRTAFYVKGVTYGSTCLITEAKGVADTMQVATFPATLVASGPDTVESGLAATYTYVYLDRGGNPVSGVPAPTFTTSDSTIAKVTGFGTIKARAPGVATLTFKGVGAPAGGNSGIKAVLVKAGQFTGGVSPTSGSPGDTVTLTNAVGGPGFDADTRVSVGGARTFVFGLTAPGTIKFVVPGMGVAGPVTVSVTNMGAEQIAQNFNLTSNTASFADKYDATNDDPATAPAISANGDYFIVESGVCKDGAVTAVGDDCDDFFKVTNSTGAALPVTVRLDWFTAGSDLDILWCKVATCSGPGNVVTGGGATTSNPENSTVTIPAGATWYLWINNFDPAGAKSIVARVRVSGLP